MDGAKHRKLEEKRERWRKRADAAFERMFVGKELTTFTEREDEAMLIARELAAFMLEEHLADDPQVRPVAEIDLLSQVSEAAAARDEVQGEAAQTTADDAGGRDAAAAGEVALPSLPDLFFSARPQLNLGTEGYSPRVLEKAERQAAKAPSFTDASDDLRDWPRWPSACHALAAPE